MGTDRIRKLASDRRGALRDPKSGRTGPTTYSARESKHTGSGAQTAHCAHRGRGATCRTVTRSAPRQHALDSRPARRANENRLTTVRIDQAPAPGRLNEVRDPRCHPREQVHAGAAGRGCSSLPLYFAWTASTVRFVGARTQVEPSQYRQRQHDVLVLAPLEGVADEVRHPPR